MKPSTPAPPGPSLTINGNLVSWTNNSVLIRKFTFPTSVIAAEFVRFANTESVAILVNTSIHVYSLSGSDHIISLSFPVCSITPCPYGLALSRDFSSISDADDQALKFYLISDPLLEPEPIYSSTLTRIHLTEELVHFGQEIDSPFCITYDQARSEIAVYHVRMHKPTHIFDPLYSAESDAAEYDLKNLMLTSVASFQLETSLSGLRVISASNDGHTTIAISPPKTNTVHVVIFKTGNSNSQHTSSTQSAIQPVNSFDLKGSSPVFITAFKTHPVLLVLRSPTSFYLCDPFLGLKSFIVSLPSHWTNIFRLDTYGSNSSAGLIYAASSPSPETPHSSITYHNLYLPLEPKNALVTKVFDGLRKILGQRVFQCVAFGWSLILVSSNINLSELEALVAIIVAQMFPEFGSYFSLQNDDNINHEKKKKLLSMFSDYKVGSFKFSQIIPFAVDLVSAFPEDSKFGAELQPHIILIIHYIREELRLQSAYTDDVTSLGKLLTYLEHWSGWPEVWTSSYGIVPTRKQYTIVSSIPPLEIPPNIFSTVSSFFSPSQNLVSFPLLSEIYKDSSLDDALIPTAIIVCKFFALADQGTNFVKFFKQPIISKKFFNSLATGVQYAMYECLRLASQYFVQDDTSKLWDILCRNDLLLSSSVKSPGKRDQLTNHGSKDTAVSSKDVLSHIGTVGELEYMAAWDEQTEIDRNQISRLIFSSDRRFYEVSKLLQSSNPRVISMPISPNMSDAEILAKQEETFYSSVLRTCTVPMGRAAFYFSARKPLATEKYPIPRLNFTVVLKPRDITITLQKDGISEENLSWGYFHNGVSAGLSLSKTSPCVNGNWIVFNKPQKLNSQHAGFILGIGLNGHLKNLEEWHIYNYLGPKHTHTTIALLIGMAASCLGSMNTKLTKVLSVHIFALLPPGSNDLNVPVEVQTAGVIGMGLLYLESSHRRMTETFLGELEGRNKASMNSASGYPSGSNTGGFFSSDDRIHTNESYKLATGFTLGLINLCKGQDLRGLHDVRIVDRLISRIVNPRDVQTSQLEISIPGSIAAILLMFLKTENKGVARKMQPPNNVEAYDYIRPDFLLLRAAAAKLIMWNEIRKDIPKATNRSIPNRLNGSEKKSTATWFQWASKSIPDVVKKMIPKNVLAELNDYIHNRASTKTSNAGGDILRELVEENSGFNENSIAYSSDHLPYYYIRCGICFALAIRFASSCDKEIRDLLLNYLDFVCVITESSSLVAAASNAINGNVSLGNTYDLQLFRQALLHIQNTLCLSVSIIMCGSGDLEVLRRLRRLAQKTRKDTCGINIAVSQALGYLFLGGGQYRFDISPDVSSSVADNLDMRSDDNKSSITEVSNRKIAFLIIANWPVYPRVLIDNSSYLQPLRYLWALSTKMCCVVVREVETGAPCDVELIIKSICDSANDNSNNNQESGVVYIDSNGREINVIKKKAPCLLPSLKNVISIETQDDRYSHVFVDLVPSNDGINYGKATTEGYSLRESFLKEYTLFVTKRRTFLSKATEILQSPSNVLSEPSALVNGAGISVNNIMSVKGHAGKSHNHFSGNTSSSSDVVSLLSSLKLLQDTDVSYIFKDRDLRYRSFENGPVTISNKKDALKESVQNDASDLGNVNTNNNSLLFQLLSTARKPHSNEDLWQLRTVFEARGYVKRKEEEEEREAYETDARDSDMKKGDSVIKKEEDFKIEEMKTLLWKWKMKQV